MADFWASGFWATDFWADGFWFTDTVAPAAPTIEIDQGAAISVAVGNTALLTTTVTGEPDPVVTWESANEAIVTVSALGIILGISEGGPVDVTATATNSEGVDTDVIAVTVTAAPASSGGITGITGITQITEII